MRVKNGGHRTPLHFVSPRCCHPVSRAALASIAFRRCRQVGYYQRFLVLVVYYRRFILNFSRISKPITELLKKDTKYVWSKDCDEAF
jgi:hypothetical protein